jgi:uncharacterized protein YndB with AHSA1/START domain
VTRVSLVLVLLAAAPPARTLELPERAETALAQGRPFVDVAAGADGVSGVVRAAIDVPAPREVVWRLMTDCELATKFVANLKSCRVLERAPDGGWDVREEVSKGSLFGEVRTVYRETFEKPERMRFQRVDGDLKVFEGEWRLTAHGDVTRVTYEARVAAPFAVPGWMSRMALRADLPNALSALRREAVARAHDG